MMDNFSYSRPATLRDATAQLGKERGKVALIAGGTDLLGEMKDNLRGARARWSPSGT